MKVTVKNTSDIVQDISKQGNSCTEFTFIPHGHGTLRWPDGASYTGDIRDGKANGNGKFTHANGDTYDGQFLDDQAHGQGEYIYHEYKQRYIGGWVNDMQHGIGREELCDGSVYEGYFFEGRKHGFGRYQWLDQSVYCGYWEANEMSGYGQFIAADQRKYTGLYQNS